MDRNILQEKVEAGYSISKLSTEFKLAGTTIRYWLKKYELVTVGYIGKYEWKKEDIINAVANAGCKSDVLRNLNISTKSGNFQTLEKHCKKLSIDLSHLQYRPNRSTSELEKSNEEVFVINSSYSRKNLKKRIIKQNLIEYKCTKCFNEGRWQGANLTLQLDHINGINDDNRLGNLRFLCPNCHSQTATFGSKNKKGAITQLVE